MKPHWERIETPPHHGGPLFMQAVLTPHRSLSRKAFVMVLGAFACADGAITTIFLLQGAWPVALFLVLDVAALWLAFAINYRDARSEEHVEVAADRVLVSRFSPNGRGAHWIVSPVWARVATDARSVRIASAGRAVRVGSFLSPPERGDFARALASALHQARGYNPSTSRME